MRHGRLVALGMAIALLGVVATQPALAQQASACVTGGAVSDAANTGLVSDCEALLEARDTLAGTGSLNWSDDIPITEWDGIRLGGKYPSLEGTPARVTRLYLHGSGLNGTIPGAFGGVTELKWLYLHRNSLTGEIPAGLNSLSKLQWLYLYDNELTGISGDFGAGMTGLRRLFAHRNALAGNIPAQLGSIPNLDWLTLYRNRLTGEIPSELGGLKKLRRLYIHENELTGVIPAELGEMASLTHILVHRNGLSGGIPVELGALTNLVWLSVYDNELTGTIPPVLGGLSKLDRLYLHGNTLEGGIPSELGGLASLTNLWLNDNLLTGDIPKSLDDLENLERWRLSGNDFTGCLPAGLAEVEDSDLDELGLAVCGEEPEVVDPTPVSMTIAAGEAAVVTHDSGAQIEIPAGTTTESATVSITEVTPPETILSVGRTFDFAVTNASGEDVELRGPVTLRLPYSLSEGKNEADVAVLRWNEDVRRWEAVHGGVVDGASRMVTVGSPRLSAKNTGGRGTSGVMELGTVSTGEYNTPMEHFARSTLSLVTGHGQLTKLFEGLDNQYGAGFKHLVSFHVKEGFRPPFFPAFKLGEVGLSLVFDVDDLLSLPAIQKVLNAGIIDEKDKVVPITGEGNAHYVTFWLNANAALKAEASAEFPVGISFSMPYTDRHPATPNHNEDPKFDASFSAMTISYPVGQVSFLNINSNGNFHPVDAQLGTCVTCELKLKAGVSFADVSFNIWKGELNTNVLNEALAKFMKPDRDTCSEEQKGNSLPDKTDPSGEVSQEFAASELVCSIFQGGVEAIETLLGRSVARFTSTEELSPDELAQLDPAEYNKITAVAGGHDINSDGGPDMVFPSRDEDGSPLSDLPLTVVTTADRFEDRDYFVKLLNQEFLESFGWTIRTKDENDDRYDFEGDALSINATEWLVTTTDDAAVELTARFELVHDESLRPDDELHVREVVLRKDRVLSDLSIEATGNPTTVLTGDTLTYGVEITNEGHHPAREVNLHLANMLPEGFVLKDVTTSYGPLDCEEENFVGLTCDLPDLIADRSIDVTLEFEPVQCLPKVPACFPPGYDDIRTVFTVESRTEDPTLGNNSAEVRTIVKHATDRDALVALYNATDGDNWYDNTNWLSDAPLGQWYGVTTDSDGRVTRVSLHVNNLSGKLPEDLGILRRLTHLVLWDNDLSGEIPEALGDLSELECLSLWSNELTGEIPEVLGDLTNLTQLDLLRNDLDGSIPAVLGDLTNLRRLHLAENDLSGSIPSSLGNLTSLESLYLFRNNLAGQIPSTLANLTNLDWLYISENGFTGCVPAGLRNVPNHDLGSLALDDCAQQSTSGGVARDNSIVPMQNDDFDAEVQDIVFPSGDVFAGESANIQAKFKNLSSSTGPHGGAATFDLTIYVEPPSGTATRFSWDNEEFTLNQERTFSGLYTFDTAGTYTVYAEVYDINGQQNGWNADHQFDQSIETFTVRAPVTVQISPASYTVDEDDGEVDITLTLEESLSSAWEVRMVTSEGTAERHRDYTPVSTTVTIPANTTSQTESVTIIDNQTLEATSESFTVSLESVQGSALLADTTSATVTITDDDEVTVGFQRRSYQQREGRDLELCVVVTPDLHLDSPQFDVHLSYDDLHGVGVSGPSSLPFDRPYRVLCGRYELPDDNVVEEDSRVEFSLDSVTSDSSGVASRVNFGISMSALTVTDDDRALVEFEHASYSVTEGNSVELCAVLREGDSVAFPFAVDLSYTDPDGAISSGPTSFNFGYLAEKSCGDFQTSDDDVGTGTSEVSFSLTGPSDLDNRIAISRTTATLTVIDDDPPSGTVSVTVTSNWLGRTVTVDGTNRTTPYTVTWNSGSSHTLDVPSPQTVSGGRYVFSSWSHGGSRSQTVSPTSHTTYTANFTFQPDPTSHPPAAVGVSPLPPFQQDVSLISGFTQTFVARASDQDSNITEWEWFVDDVSRSRLSFAPTGIVTSQVNIQFIKPGSHTVKATFTDSTGLSDSFSWEVEVRGPDLTTCPGESGTARRGSVPYDGAMVNLSLTGVSPARGILQHEAHLC